jgi:acyl-coenzyme A thioesterase PaaI-like protein
MSAQNEMLFAAERAAILRLPYVQMLGFDVVRDGAGVKGLLPFAEHLIGNPLVPALHGGVLAALLHFTAAAELMLALKADTLPQIFTCTIEYLASPELRDCEASAEIVSISRRFANVRVTAWQPHSGKTVARATMQFLTNTAPATPV